MHPKPFIASLVTFATLIACADDPSKPTDKLQVYYGCLETMCAQQTQRQNDACNACSQACSSADYGCDPATACSDSCSPASCDDPSACAQQGWTVTYPNDPSQAVADACNAALSTINACGYTLPGSMTCDDYAAVDTDAAASIFTCIAQLDCNSVADSTAVAACNQAAPTTFGDALCSQWQQTCPNSPCTSDMQSALDADGAILREDALDAATSCLSAASCQDTLACLSTWRSAVE
jgi:hypothetical protein